MKQWHRAVAKPREFEPTGARNFDHCPPTLCHAAAARLDFLMNYPPRINIRDILSTQAAVLGGQRVILLSGAIKATPLSTL